jgi:hypothetical protein
VRRLGQIFASALKSAIKRGGDEPNIVERFVNRVWDKRTSFGPAVNVQTAFVHQRPYALFRNPAEICDFARCELGDLLLVFKRINDGEVIDHRATFLQAKKGLRAWPIAPHQLEFLRNVNNYEFEFGRKTLRMGHYDPIRFRLLAWPVSWAHYLCLDEDEPSLVYDTERVYNHLPGNCTSFTLRNEPCRVKWKTNCVRCDGFSAFMHKFTQPAGVGLDITTDDLGKDMVTIVFRRVGLEVDPAEEWEDYFLPAEKDVKRSKERPEGFGVIFITAKGPPEGEETA